MTVVTEQDVQPKPLQAPQSVLPNTEPRSSPEQSAAPVVRPKTTSPASNVGVFGAEKAGSRRPVVPQVAKPVDSGTWTAMRSDEPNNSAPRAGAMHARTGSGASLRSNTRVSDPAASRVRAEVTSRPRSAQPPVSTNPFEDESEEQTGTNPFETKEYPSQYNPFH